MKRALALSITLLLPLVAVAATDSPAATRYRLLHVEAPTPTAAGRYQVSTDAGVAIAAGRYQLLGTVAAQAAGDACESGDELFAHGFEN